MNTKKVVIFSVVTLLLSTLIALVLKFGMGALDNAMISTTIMQMGLMGMMFVPAIVALIVKADFKNMGWNPHPLKNWFWILFSLVIPIILMGLGAALFFLVFPELFDSKCSYLSETMKERSGQDIEAVLASAGLDMKLYVVITVVQCVTLAPFLNMIPALGEEIGWRGFLYPELKKKFGRIGCWIIGGSIWGAFHFGAMIFLGYEYGFDYFGAPVLGLVAFALFCILIGMIEELIYSSSKSIWYPALFHGSINAAANLGTMFLSASDPDKIERMIIFGPAGNGLIPMIPFLITAVLMAVLIPQKKAEVKKE